MNTQYAKIAVATAQKLRENKDLDPEKAWNDECTTAKGCPKGTFLTLCHDGNIKGVEVKMNLKIRENADYTRQMMKYIKEKKGNIESKNELWEIVEHPKKPKTVNGQPDVIFGLLHENLLNF